MDKLIKSLKKVANELDMMGHSGVADKADHLMLKVLDVIEEEHSSYMAKPQLAQIEEFAKELYHMIPEHMELPDWCESKIAIISAYIADVHRYIKSKSENFDIQK